MPRPRGLQMNAGPGMPIGSWGAAPLSANSAPRKCILPKGDATKAAARALLLAKRRIFRCDQRVLKRTLSLANSPAAPCHSTFTTSPGVARSISMIVNGISEMSVLV